MLFALCYTKALWSAGRSLLHSATFLRPFEKFLRNTRKVPATGATPSHWPSRNGPIEPAYNHEHQPTSSIHRSLQHFSTEHQYTHQHTHTHWHSLNTTDKTSNTHTVISAQIHGGVLSSVGAAVVSESQGISGSRTVTHTDSLTERCMFHKVIYNGGGFHTEWAYVYVCVCW